MSPISLPSTALLAPQPTSSRRATTTEPLTLGATIHKRRRDLEMSMRELAEKSGLKSVASIADIEKGHRNPSPELLKRIERALGVKSGEFRNIDTRPPVREIKRLADANPQWAVAFRLIVDSAEGNRLSAGQLIEVIKTQNADADQPESLPAPEADLSDAASTAAAC